MRSTVAHVVGARPNFVKSAPVIRAMAQLGIEQRLIHTGQHYDERMSDVFFRDLDLPEPDENLGVGSGSHATQTARLMVALERSFRTDEPPALIVIYGDVNSTLAAALVAAKLGLPVAHVEAGLRSFDDSMPEEVNRRVTDLLSDLLFVTSLEGMANLGATGVRPDRVHFVGNPMIDTLLANLPKIDPVPVRAKWALPDRYAVATLHRPANVDDPAERTRIVAMLERIADAIDIVIPLHPRGRITLTEAGLGGPHVHVLDPLGYLEFVSLMRDAAVVVTDSGGVQEETTILGVPCLTVRPNTERPITITHGTNRLADPDDVPGLVRAILADGDAVPDRVPPLWDGRAGPRIAAVVSRWLDERSRREKNAARLSSS